jgi:hypothetical protein
MTRKLRDLAELPLRNHGSRERIDRVWRRLAPELGPSVTAKRPAALWGPGLLVAVFGAGVFVGARFVRPDVEPVLSAERASVPEPAAGLAAPAPDPVASTAVVPPKLPERNRTRPAPLVLREEPVEPAEQPFVPAIAASAPVSASPPEWEKLAEAGDFEAARAALESAGGFEAVLVRASASELMTLVDIARASGSRERAVAALRRVMEAFRDAPEAPLAAWTLGNLLDQAGDDTGATEAFALYRRLSPGGDFAEDALAHEVARAFARGDLELSARLVAQYENEFPNGPRLEEFRAELGKRAARAAGVEPADEPASAGDAESDSDAPAAVGESTGAAK